MFRWKFVTIAISMLVVFCISSVFATPDFSLGPTPKYAKRVEDLPPGLYIVIYPQGDKGPIPVPRSKTTIKGQNFYTLILVLMEVSFEDAGFEPFVAEVEAQNVEWKDERDGMSVRQQLIEVSRDPTKKASYFHPRADELHRDFCIYRLINTNGSEKCS